MYSEMLDCIHEEHSHRRAVAGPEQRLDVALKFFGSCDNPFLSRICTRENNQMLHNVRSIKEENVHAYVSFTSEERAFRTGS
jgi:hypothetical protein